MDDSINYVILKKIINDVDPLGLVDLDTPESLNEYDSELKEIFKKDISCLNSEDLSEWIRYVFVDYFNESLANGKEKYDLIANKYLDSINKND